MTRVRRLRIPPAALTAGLAFIAALAPGCAGPKTHGGGETLAAANGVPEVVPEIVPDVMARLIGSFSSAAQAEADPEFFDVRLHMTPIWTSRTDGPWLYVEQAMATALDRPYRQRVYRLIDRGDGSVESFVYELPNPRERIGAWSDPTRFDSDRPEALVPRAGCSIVLRRSGDAWVGSTHERDCESALRGASYATSEVVLRADGLETWDRGFDDAGRQVWGASKGPYRFRRTN